MQKKIFVRSFFPLLFSSIIFLLHSTPFSINTLSIQVRQREKHLIEEVHTAYGKQTMDLLSRKNDLQAQLDSLRSTCSLTEVVLNGKDIELLLLKKDVQEKLTLLNKGMDFELPRSLSKEIKFFPGKMELGMILDVTAQAGKTFRMR